jgi:hypothetical protein
VKRVERELRLAVTTAREGGADVREGEERQAPRLPVLQPQPVRQEGLGQEVHLGLKGQDDDRRHELWWARAYWITSSATERTAGGMVTPSAFAVRRLITSSNRGSSTGRSPGGVPLRILSTCVAARR